MRLYYAVDSSRQCDTNAISPIPQRTCSNALRVVRTTTPRFAVIRSGPLARTVGYVNGYDFSVSAVRIADVRRWQPFN